MGFVESCWIRCRLQIVAVSCFDGVGSGQKQSFVSNANLDHNSLVMPANVQVGFHAKLACIKSHIKVLSCAGHPSIVESQQLLARFRCMAFRQSSWAYQDGEECPLLAVCVGQHWVAKAFFKGVFLLFANCHFFSWVPNILFQLVMSQPEHEDAWGAPQVLKTHWQMAHELRYSRVHDLTEPRCWSTCLTLSSFPFTMPFRRPRSGASQGCGFFFCEE